MSGFIYFIRPIGTLGPVKIGHSFAPSSRCVDLTRFSPYPLEVAASVPGDQDLERLIQNCFADAHSHGEWFLPHPRLVAAIADLQRGVPVADAIDLTKPIASVLGLIHQATRDRNGTNTGRPRDFMRAERRKARVAA